MKQIEHLPAVVLCATLVPPCFALHPREIRPRRTRPLARLDANRIRRAKPRGVCLLLFVPARAPRRQFVF